VALAIVGLGSIGWYLRDTEAIPPTGNGTPAPVETPKVTVPDFVGTSAADVVKTADLIGLTVVMSDGQGAQAAFLDGVVTSQTPPAGASVDRQARIELLVATQTVTMPTLVGTTLTAAVEALDRDRLRLGKTASQPVADAKPGTIVRQMPEAGEMVAAGTAVDVVVATTPRPPARRMITVPNFLGSPSATAEAEARRLGITLSKIDAEGKRADAVTGIVIAQVPAPNTQLAAQGTVQIRIAAAGTVPQLIGLTLDAAREMVGRTGLRLGNVQRRVVQNATPGSVVAQAPSAGTRARQGASVNVVVAAAPPN
jgi:beta-lactam-binding protein with PASTA domain